MNDAPVFIIDDDKEEFEMVQEIMADLGYPNPLEYFSCAADLIDRLKDNINPFMIISDVNLPGMDGFTLREKLANGSSTKHKSIPFVFWSTAASPEQIQKAYDSGGHGFFLKGGTYKEIKESLNIIMSYWRMSKAPVLNERGQITNQNG